MKHHFRIAAMALAIASIASLGVSAGASAATATKVDEAFVSEMPLHHEMAIEMAKMAVEQAEHGKIKSTAQKIIKAQKGEIARLEKIAKRLGVEPVAEGDHMQMMDELDTLGLTMKQADGIKEHERAGRAKPFDRQFIDMMIPIIRAYPDGGRAWRAGRDTRPEIAGDVTGGEGDPRMKWVPTGTGPRVWGVPKGLTTGGRPPAGVGRVSLIADPTPTLQAGGPRIDLTEAPRHQELSPPRAGTAVLEASGMLRASEKAVVEAAIGRRPGVMEVEANPVAQTATVTYDPDRDLGRGAAPLGRGVRLPPPRPRGPRAPLPPTERARRPPGAGVAPPRRTPPSPHAGSRQRAPGRRRRSPDEVMGHGGQADMSMAAMVADMRNRFLVAAVLSVPILLWSSIGRDVLGFSAGVPFGLREDVWR